ncbi:uncharacterized protein BDR25DRAFT_363585 [Lindgomyces ingoldianus]|uniref:Uncharacterized protein n=1 Tax=Lindgomyces ingoldianus TaxID=673940 RepID=A0ACB6Q7E6_9PLEO|nr:uncharacterized protein BDR25DRAFT_363585 [Lindgomyces ingoldianus]KAF2462746.1 hypothetical protein BDR25DRAFT_363585 [Lindgomyces ingoldianus]
MLPLRFTSESSSLIPSSCASHLAYTQSTPWNLMLCHNWYLRFHFEAFVTLIRAAGWDHVSGAYNKYQKYILWQLFYFCIGIFKFCAEETYGAVSAGQQLFKEHVGRQGVHGRYARQKVKRRAWTSSENQAQRSLNHSNHFVLEFGDKTLFDQTRYNCA